jgi:hypothetical protein
VTTMISFARSTVPIVTGLAMALLAVFLRTATGKRSEGDIKVDTRRQVPTTRPKGATMGAVARVSVAIPLTVLVLLAGLAALVAVVRPTEARRKLVVALASRVVDLAQVLSGAPSRAADGRRTRPERGEE